jgi:ribosomal-protein-alanine N-acetyltransferase
MKLELHTERLLLTPLASNDVDVALDMFTDPEVTQFVDGVMSAEKITKSMPDWIKRGGDGCIGIWCISDRKSGEKYGSAALLPMPVDENDTDYNLVVPGRMPAGDVEIGYFLKRSAWGRGFATEVCKRLLQFAFQKTSLTEVVATFDEKNIASEHVLKKAGFVDKGTMRCYGETGPNYRITHDNWSRMR